jgi:hypothetical protein
MAQPFIALGLKGANTLIEKHFDKVPDKALHPETYHPANLTSKQRRQRTREKRAAKNKIGSSSSNDEDSTEEAEEITVDRGGIDIQEEQRGAPRNMFSPPQTATYAPPQQEMYVPGAPLYSHEPPRLRPEYAPSPPPIGSGYPYAQGAYAPPPSPQTIETRARRDSNDDEDYYSDSYRHRRRPKPVTRRSSSYHGPRGGDQQLSRRGGPGSDTLGKARDRAHRYGFKDEVEGMFTKSKEGLAGGAVGALVGGWAAHKAQEAKGREKHATSPLITLLGAAVGGLAVNAVIDKYEAGKADTSEKQAKSDDKFGSDGGRDREAGSDKGSRRGRRRRESNYADGYGSDEESDGSKSYRSGRSRRGKRESRGNMSDGYD